LGQKKRLENSRNFKILFKVRTPFFIIHKWQEEEDQEEEVDLEQEALDHQVLQAADQLVNHHQDKLSQLKSQLAHLEEWALA
jgi:hypothetical protein